MTDFSAFTLDCPLPPQWLMYPEIPCGSIGWRMGYGESYRYLLSDWLETLSPTDQQQYHELFPAPISWDSERYQDLEHALIAFWRENGQPAYDRYQLIEESKTGKTIDYLFFWGHHPSKDGLPSPSVFSQWWISKFNSNVAFEYCCMEQYMMRLKAELFNDEEIADKILNTTDPKAIKALGRQVHNFDEKIWNRYKYSIVLNGNFDKFMQNKPLRDFLLSTQDQVIVEASPYDRVWGIGLKATDAKATQPQYWAGQNLLGFALMEVRSEIRRLCANEHLIDWGKVNHFVANRYG